MNESKNKYQKKDDKANCDDIWINPVGGYGDMLMVSGVLKLAFDRNPAQKYKLARRTRYSVIFQEHPAIDYIGFPPKDAHVIRTDYWAKEKLGDGNHRPFQILARAFGLSTPIKETLYLAGKTELDDSLNRIIPWAKRNILIAPESDSPRKVMPTKIWERLVEKLLKKNYLVIQVGRIFERSVKGAYSLVGLTSPQQLVGLIKKVDLVITMDNFIMHAAYLTGTKAIAIFGPTQPEIYGYKDQIVLKPSLSHCNKYNKCLGPDHPNNYLSPCPFNDEEHCMNKISEEDIFKHINSYFRDCV